MFNRNFGGGFGGFGGGGGGNFGNQFNNNRFQSGFVGGPGGNSGLMGMNRGGFRGGFSGNQRYGGGGYIQQQQRGGLFGRGRGSYTPRGGSRGGSKNTPNSNNKDSGKKDTKDDGDNKQKDDKTHENEAKKAEEEKNGQPQKDVVELKPRPASMDFGGPVGKKADGTQTVGDLPVGAKPPWETKKKAGQQDQKVDKFGAPWEKKKNDDLAEKANNAPWEIKKAEQNKLNPPWTTKQEPKEVPPWKQKEEKSEEVIDLSTPPWTDDDDKAIGPPPWLQQQGQKNSANSSQQPRQQQQQQTVKKEPLFDSRKRSYESSQPGQPSGPKPDVKAEAVGLEQTQASARVTLDTFNSDLNLVINNDGYSAETLNKPMGFCFCWGGARGTYGVTRGKICFEVKVTRNLAVDFGDDHEEEFPHVVRVGWSVDSHGFQLGEDQDSFGFGGTGKFSANCRFSNYGQTYGVGDVIMALLDLEAKPPNISFAKNGRWFGVAHRLGAWPQGVKEKALFPHVLSKNCAFEVNFGQRTPFFKPPPDFVFIDDVPLHQRVRGMMPPTKVSDCEIIMVVGLPGAGKTTWGLNMQKEHKDKRFNIIGTDTLIDKMKVNGLPRKNNYHGRWEVLIKKATECLNKLFQIGSKRCRNYILDQTNVYATARKRKMRNFEGFKRICAVLVTSDPELERRAYQRTYVDGKFVPDEAVLEMKANFSLPHESEPHIDRLMWIELSREQALPLIEQYNTEGQKNRPPRSKAFPHDNRSQSQDRRDGRDNSDNRMGHQRSYSDRGPQGDRGRSWERNQDRPPQRGGFDKHQGSSLGGPGNRDRGFPERSAGRRNSDVDTRKDSEPGDAKRHGQAQHASWQKQPGNRQEWAHGGRDESPVARREDIPFKKPKVEPLDTGNRIDRDGRNQSWPPQTGHVKEERMDIGHEPARFGGSGNRFLGDKDVDYRMSGPDSGRPGTHGTPGRPAIGKVASLFDEHNPTGNRFGNPTEARGKDERAFQGNQFGANRGDNRFGPPQDGRFARDQRDFSRPDRFKEGPGDQFRSPNNSFNQPPPVKAENPFMKTEDNPFLARLAEFDKERPLRFDQYVKNTPRNDDDIGKGFGFRRGGNYSGGRYGQEGRGGDNRFGGDKKYSGDNRYNADNRFGGNNRNEPFLARGPGGLNKDRQDTPRDGSSSRPGLDRDNRRKVEEEGRFNRGSDDKDKYRERSARRQDDDRREPGKKQESRDSRWHGPGEEWSGGGDTSEWQGGGGDMPPHIKKLNDPRESGDGVRSAQIDARPVAGDKDLRWNTENKRQNWNQSQQQQYGRDEGATAKDVDYRQPEQQWSAQETRGAHDMHTEGENYATRGWTEGVGPQDPQTASYKPEQSKNEPFQQGEWNDPTKAGWQGGGSGNKDKRWEEQARREEWSGGWGSTGSAQQTADNPSKRSDDNSRWTADQYGAEYKQQQQYSYPTGYEEQQYDSYSAETKLSDKDQHAYSQQTHDQASSQEWNQYSQQGWDGYGYGDWNQQQAATTDAESKSTKVGNTPSSSSQTNWSEYKAVGSTTSAEPSDSASNAQNANNPYGHYSQTSTTVKSGKETQQTWDSGNYGYEAQAQQSSAGPYSHGTQNSSGANASPQISQASLLGAAANISLPPNLDLNAIQQSLAAHGFAQPPPPPPGPAPGAPGGVLYPGVTAYQAGSGLAGIAPGLPHGAGMYSAVRRQ